MPGTGFALGVISFIHLPPDWSVLGCVVLRSCHQPFWSDGSKRHCPENVNLRVTSFFGCGQIDLWD